MNWIKFQHAFPNIYEDIREFEKTNTFMDDRDLINKYINSYNIDLSYTFIKDLEKLNKEIQLCKIKKIHSQ